MTKVPLIRKELLMDEAEKSRGIRAGTPRRMTEPQDLEEPVDTKQPEIPVNCATTGAQRVPRIAMSSVTKIADRLRWLAGDRGSSEVVMSHRQVLEQAADRLEELQAIIDTLPKTEDGVAVTHGMTTWCSGEPSIPHVWLLRLPSGENFLQHCARSGEHHYSTREAALAVRKDE